MSLYVAIDDVPYEGSTLKGVYSTFEEARDDVEARTAADKALEYQRDYGIHTCNIEEWDKGSVKSVWHRDYEHPLNWVEGEW